MKTTGAVKGAIFLINQSSMRERRKHRPQGYAPAVSSARGLFI
jgi:hypothetical protein